MYAKYTPVQIRFLQRIIPGRSVVEATALFNTRFGMELSESQIHGFMKNHNIRNGKDTRFKQGHISHNKGLKGVHYSPKTEFKMGNRPWNWRPVGSVRINKLGYVEVKTAEPNVWKTKHRAIWEKKNGAVPKGHVIIFADGNKLNMRLNNLIIVSRSELSVMNHLGLISTDRKLTAIGKSVADIKLLIASREKQNNQRKKSKQKRCRVNG